MIFTRGSPGLNVSVMQTEGAQYYKPSPLTQTLSLPQDVNGWLLSIPSKIVPNCLAWKSCSTSNSRIINHLHFNQTYIL